MTHSIRNFWRRGDLLEQSCLGVGNTKTRRTLRQQLTVIYCSMFRLCKVARERERKREREGGRERERERICKGLWIDTKRHAPSQPNRTLWMQTSNSRLTKWLTLFVLRPNTGQVWHKASLKVDPDAGPQPTRVQQNPKFSKFTNFIYLHSGYRWR